MESKTKREFFEYMYNALWYKRKQLSQHVDETVTIKNSIYLNIRKIQIEPRYEKIYLMLHANNKGADQPAHPRSLISVFVVRCLEQYLYLLYPKFQDLSRAGQFESNLVATPKTGSRDEAQL